MVRDDVNELLDALDKRQLMDFIRRECADDIGVRTRFLSLGKAEKYRPAPSVYSSRIEQLINLYGDRYGYIHYDKTFEFSSEVERIISEAEEAIDSGRPEVAFAVLVGVSDAAEDILDCGDDSYGNLGRLVEDCFKGWRNLAAQPDLPVRIKADIFDLALNKFRSGDLKGWDWHWSWMDLAISSADTTETQNIVLKEIDSMLDGFAKTDSENSSRYEYNTARSYKLELMTKSCSNEQMREYLYKNKDYSDFRKRLLQMAWEEGKDDEVLELAKDGLKNDKEYAGLMMDWKGWEFKVYKKRGDVPNILSLARFFFFNSKGWRDEYPQEEMYSLMKSLVPEEEWREYVSGLIEEAKSYSDSKHLCEDNSKLLYIYDQEAYWKEYMQYIRMHQSVYLIDSAPKILRETYKAELLTIYEGCIRKFFLDASGRSSYERGADLLRNLINYGGEASAKTIIEEQISRKPRRPALISILSNIELPS